MHKETLNQASGFITNRFETGEMSGGGVFLIGGPDIWRYSKSPAIWNGVFADLGIDAQYKAIGIESEDNVRKTLELFAKDPDYLGGNVGKPHKEYVYGWIKDNGRVDSTAERVEAVNTIVNEGGILVGYNTDGKGEIENLKSVIPDFSQIRVLANGAGGGALGVVPEILEAGTRTITIANRGVERARTLAARMRKFYPDAKVDVAGENEVAELAASGNFDLILNMTSKGQARLPDEEGYSSLASTGITLEQNLAASRAALTRLRETNPDAVCADIIYNPELSPFLVQARDLGLRVVGGKMMLIHQAAIAAQYVLRDKLTVPYGKLVQSMEASFDKA
jgi:shikimate dehydrogenase